MYPSSLSPEPYGGRTADGLVTEGGTATAAVGVEVEVVEEEAEEGAAESAGGRGGGNGGWVFCCKCGGKGWAIAS